MSIAKQFHVETRGILVSVGVFLKIGTAVGVTLSVLFVTASVCFCYFSSYVDGKKLKRSDERKKIEKSIIGSERNDEDMKDSMFEVEPLRNFLFCE